MNRGGRRVCGSWYETTLKSDFAAGITMTSKGLRVAKTTNFLEKNKPSIKKTENSFLKVFRFLVLFFKHSYIQRFLSGTH